MTYFMLNNKKDRLYEELLKDQIKISAHTLSNRNGLHNKERFF